MSEKKANLKKAREALAAKEWRDVLSHCKSVLKEDRACYEAYVYVGKAAFQLGEFEQADLSYQKATELNDKSPQAWQGLSELYVETQQWVKAAEADQVLVDLAHRGDASLAARLPALVRRLGAAHAAAGQLEEAEVALREVLVHPLPPEEKLPVLAQLADVQLREDSAELEAKVQQRLQEKRREAADDGSKVCEHAVRSAVMSEAADEALELDCDHATPTIKEIICGVAPTPPYVKYHDTYLRRLRQAVNVAEPGTMDRHNRRVAVLEVCRAMMEGRCAAEPFTGKGCASPYAYETALRLLEIEEEIAGAHMPRISSAEFTPGGGGLRSFTSAMNSPRSGSGFATPTAAGNNAMLAAAAMLSPGSFFSSSLQLPAAASRIGSLSLAGLPPRSGAATPSAASMTGAFLPTAGTPKRDMSSARLSELVHNPMAAAAAAAGASMAEQERESFSQLAAEASTAGTASATTANGTPSGVLSAAMSATPVGSLGRVASLNAGAPELQGSESLGPYAAASFNRGMGGLSVAVPGNVAAGGGMISRYSSSEMLAAASPRFAMASPRFAGTLTPLTPTRSGIQPAAAPLLMNDRELIGRRLAHVFPWNATAQVHLAMALRRREAYVLSGAATIKLQCGWQGPGVTDLSCSPLAQRLRAERPRQAARKAWLADLLAKGLARGAPVVSGMIGLAELRLEAGDAAGALAAAKQGLKFVFDRSKIRERARHAALVLNLLAGQALLGTGQLTDAGRIFVRLAQRVSEGEVSFGSEAVGMPATSIRQQAIRGLAQVALAQGDTCQALHHYGELVSKALMGRGSAEHWAYAEYGWLLFKEGNADAGRYQLETALDVLYKQAAVLPGCESVLASYHYKLARIYWALDGSYRCEREHCLQHLLDAAAEEGPQQAEAFEWLGHWYSQVARDEFRARKCYQRALALNPTLEGAGNELCDLLQVSRGAQAASLEAKLLEEMLLRAPDAHWARGRLARLQLQTGQYEQAVASFQGAIRSTPKSAELWEGLAASYQALGRHASALKSYSRTLELDPARPYALMSCGALHYMAGAYQDAAQQYRAALLLLPQHPAALLGLAEVLLSSACRHMAMGAAGAATLELTEAAERAAAAVSGVKVEEQAAAAANGVAGEATAAREAADAPQQRHVLLGSNLATAWKLLGDILLQKHLLQPLTAAAAANATTASTHGDTAAAAVAAALQHLSARRQLLQHARRAYSRALALNPAGGELWGDLALCYSHEAKLLQQLQPQQPAAQQGATAGAIAAARAAAVRAARGGLRLSPASSWLWGVLAGALAAAGHPAAAEFSYSRALALDPKAAALWVQLGRLYSRHGSAELAEQCYEAARGAEPTLVLVWEAMAATAAARGSSSAGTAAAAAAAEHAVGLGGGPESWLEYATAGLRGRASQAEGLLLACACKASAHQPLLLPPHAALAAALEARGQHSSAVAALQYCIALLQAGLRQGTEGLAALGLTGFGQGSGQATHRVVLLQAAGFEGSEGIASPESVQVALEIALARNLTLAGQYEPAVQLYGKLEQQGSLGSNPMTSDSYSWVCYGFAAQQLGQAGLCSRVLERAVEEAGSDSAKLHAVMALLQHQLSRGALEAAFSLLLQHMPQLTASSPGLADACTRAWLALAVAAAAAGEHDLQTQVVDVMRQAAAAQLQHVDMAWVECELRCISAAAQAAADAKTGATRSLAHAVHACPWHVPARLRLADHALAGNPRKATAVYRACPGLLPESYAASSSNSVQQQQQQQQQQQGLLGMHISAASQSAQQLGLQEVLSAASCRATALSGQVAAAVAAEAGQEVARLRRLLHALPSSPDLWYCLALAALLQAIGDGQAAHFRRAQQCCLSALNRVDQLMAEQQQQQQAPASAAAGSSASSSARSLLSCKLQELQEVKVRLMVAVSECHQHSRLADCQDEAQEWAMDALAAAMAAGGVAAPTAHRQVGRMLALRGMVTEAEMAYRQAVAGSGSGGAAAGAVLELAKLLAGHGRQQEAAALLHGIWEGGAAALAAATGAGADPAAEAAAAGVSGPGPQFVEASALEEALLLADLGQWEAARAAAAAGLRLAGAAGDAAPAAADLVMATVALQAAAAAPGEGSRNLLLEARWAASSAAASGMALPGTVGTAAAGIGAAVLAQVELARSKPEKAYDAIGMSFGAWVDQAVPAQVLLAAGELTGQVTDCAAAVHTAPWLEEGWDKLKLAAIAAGRLVDVL
ncbi:hypothetical protein COO60DRAFT_1704042 [Scenedesmus sp. NREL 46B-D3]|nr:hypothetical protein COO60DRAFT_1704042 [Scenedesmus sp. NREL 46B-D3]